MIALLQKNSLTVQDFFKAEKFQLTLGERQSSAVITVGPEAPAIGVSDWLRDETDPGAGIVWRVKSVATDYATDTRTITCEHMVAALRDMIMFGEVTPGMMSGNTKDKNCTAYQAARYILNRANDWTVGSIGYSKSAPYNFNGDDLYSALETVTSSLMDAWWSYDFSTYPFKLSIKPKSTDVQCEMRMDRNIQSLKKTIDRTRMFTRFYPIGSKDLHISGGGYVEKNANLYGVVCKTETDQTKKTEAELTAWANERLNNHAEPIVTVTVSGIDMSEATGEALDKLTLGTVCRMPLPEYGTTLTERITQLSWSDKIADPESVSITLANQVEDVASIVNQLAKSAGGGGRAAAKDAKEDHAWLVDTEEKAGMLAEAVAGPGADKDWSRVSSIFADGTGLHAQVTYAEGEIVKHQTRLDQNERSIGMVVEVRNGKEMIKAAEIVASVNKGSGNIKLKADHIDIDGLVEKLETRTLGVGGLHVEGMSDFLRPAYFEAGLSSDEPINALAFKVGNQTLNVADATVDGNVLTITYVNGSTVNFSKATSLSGEWSSNKWTVTASPQGNTIAVLPQVHAVSSQGGNYTNVYVGTHDGSNWTNHGSATKLTLSASGLTVNLTDPNGSILATISAENPYPSSASMTQHQNAAGTKNFTAYYLAPDGTTYVSMGQHYWYHSGSNIGSRTVHY